MQICESDNQLEIKHQKQPQWIERNSQVQLMSNSGHNGKKINNTESFSTSGQLPMSTNRNCFTEVSPSTDSGATEIRTTALFAKNISGKVDFQEEISLEDSDFNKSSNYQDCSSSLEIYSRGHQTDQPLSVSSKECDQSKETSFNETGSNIEEDSKEDTEDHQVNCGNKDNNIKMVHQSDHASRMGGEFGLQQTGHFHSCSNPLPFQERPLHLHPLLPEYHFPSNEPFHHHFRPLSIPHTHLHHLQCPHQQLNQNNGNIQESMLQISCASGGFLCPASVNLYCTGDMSDDHSDGLSDGHLNVSTSRADGNEMLNASVAEASTLLNSAFPACGDCSKLCVATEINQNPSSELCYHNRHQHHSPSCLIENHSVAVGIYETLPLAQQEQHIGASPTGNIVYYCQDEQSVNPSYNKSGTERTINSLRTSSATSTLNEANTSDFHSYIPFILVTGILTTTLTLLVSVSVIYLKNLPLHEMNSFDENSCYCDFGAQCYLDEFTGEKRCRCETANCVDQFAGLLCGDNNLTYSSECKLRLAICQLQRIITIKHLGACDPCDGFECPMFQVCQLDSSQSPVCKCNTDCSQIFQPVCGSDGKTYNNECVLKAEACSLKQSLRLEYNGECNERNISDCDSLQCGLSYECIIDRNGAATCACPSNCSTSLKPVCGTDDHTYDSECDLRRQACQTRRAISVAHEGHCVKSGPCAGYQCDYGAYCVVNLNTSEPSCECLSCEEIFKPVCGSDGVSYGNECKMKQEACKQRKVIHLVNQGVCHGCESNTCANYSVCRIDESGNRKCICNENCSFNDSSVCGSDGKTYKSECELQRDSCTLDKYLSVAYKGTCTDCLNVHCKYGARCEKGKCICPTDCPESLEPVCSSNGLTYVNECAMRKASCKQGSEMTVSFYGECQDVKSANSDIGSGGGYVNTCNHNTCRYGGICDYNSAGVPHCICSYHCPSGSSDNEPVCGSDGRLYENECKLQEEACLRQQEIQPAEVKHCQESKILPCEGDPPLFNLTTGKEYSCSDEPSGRECPASSYCHKTSHFAKCCRQIALVRTCAESNFGCCPDKETPAQGPNHAGCPSVCNCNRLGSYSLTCDPASNQCHCKQGVGGLQCDRCEPGFWGLHKISEGNSGCIPCACNSNGSMRDDCDQMSGRCVCKHGLQGMKCDVCPEGTALGLDGCVDSSLQKTFPGTCKDHKCRFGATCVERDANDVQCVCDIKCPLSEINGQQQPVTKQTSTIICATDNNTYSSECQLRLYACRIQKKIDKVHEGKCKLSLGVSSSRRGSFTSATEAITVGPVRRSTLFKTTLKDGPEKSTRQLTHYSFVNHLSTSPTSSTPTKNEKHFRIPFFRGNSSIQLTRLQAYASLSIEMEFVSFRENAILLYNGQTVSGEGDFVSLSIKEGFVEFRYNLGSGTVILRASKKILIGSLTKLVAKRYLKEGLLTIEGHKDVTAQSAGDLKSLDLVENLFVGFVPSRQQRILENIGVSNGFFGCIHKLQIGSKDIDLRYPESKDILRANGVHDCGQTYCRTFVCRNGGTCITERDTQIESSHKCLCKKGFTGKHCDIQINPCKNGNICMNGGTCISHSSGGFSCICPPQVKGQLCSEVQHEMGHLFVPDFWGSSYLKLSTLSNIAQSFVIEIWFLTRAINGLLFYNGQFSEQGRGDFLAVNIVDGHIEYRFNLGSGLPNVSGVAIIKTKNKVSLGDWHMVRLTRQRQIGTLQLDQGEVQVGKAKGLLFELNLDQPLYIGGVEDKIKLNKDIGVVVGLNGAIQRFVINGEIWDNLVSRAIQVKGVTDYSGPPCGYQNPCLNGGICVPILNDYLCECPKGFLGKQCSKSINEIVKQKLKPDDS